MTDAAELVRTLPPDDLLALTAAMVAIPSVSHNEPAIANAIAQRLAERASQLTMHRVGDNLIARTDTGASSRILLGGHLDTVPPSDNAAPRVEGDVLHGVGSADMKGGLAVLCALAEQLSARVATGAVLTREVTLVFYVGEEVAAEHNGLAAIERRDAALLAADFAVLLEPTQGWIEAGCQGNANIEIEVHGVRAHSARPWQGVNAVSKAAPLLARLAAFDPGTVLVDGLEYRQSCQIVRVAAGVANNVVPDVCTITVNRRIAPGVTIDAVRDELAALTPEAATVSVQSVSDAAPPNLQLPLVASFVATTGASVRPKLGWTDVARFTARGIPACNFGPGDPSLAHGPRECVTRAELNTVLLGLTRALGL
ncbi:MAG: succinyl-diaminopimelate desuccinylase [Acidimicrobiia bacterium]